MDKTYTSRNGNIVLEVRSDLLSAWMTIRKSGGLIDENEISDMFDSAGITYGFDEAIQWMEKEGITKDYDIPFPIAISYKNEESKQLSFHTDKLDITDPEQALDHVMFDQLACVEAGTVIAGYDFNLFHQNKSVYNILGEMHSDENHSIVDLSGPNVEFDIGKQQYIALTDGFLYIDRNGRICILDRIIIDSTSISPSAVIRSPVSLLLIGDISDCDIISRQSIEVIGNVTNSSLYTESHLKVQGSIRDGSSKWIHVLGDTRCLSICNSRLLCKGKLIFTSQIINSVIIAESGIEGDFSESSIVGGQTLSSGDITINSVGDEFTLKTEIEVTISPYLKNLLMIKTRELLKLKHSYGDDHQMTRELNGEIGILEERLNQELNDFLQRPKEQKIMITVHNDVYPHSHFRVLKHTYTLKHHQSGIKLIEKE
ncbi:MAG: DUF342 domain-containing protein [Candidatus Cloacimonetes bacterium]|nr:DUF342 domain-containing protein [Candidatus Cloacimonadota bacterium]